MIIKFDKYTKKYTLYVKGKNYNDYKNANN